ncbi:hypothetical protein V202x_30210 [Gimesia aquarii]|uniref:Uncharacterized protein n=2 Tax=Gimesia aquarii TaxID=2527964 RepID=A0A517WWJ4_9PLAN|nr:hypothetical protein V202x_30210 [Gimesia aquarii]
MTRFDPIPPSIWSEGILQIPPRVVCDYRCELDALGRYENASGQSPKNLIGGIDEQATHDHFTWRFGASCVRTEYLMLDPRGLLAPVSTDILKCFSEGRIAVLDIPCGTGPGILGFLGLVAELRVRGCLPKQPLEVVITAGDISESARQLYDSMLNKAKPWLKHEGVRVKWKTYSWDAGDEPSTAELVDNWFSESPNFEEHVVLTAAFSGEAANNFETFERSFNHVASRLYNKCGTIIWVEPKMNDANKLLSKLTNMFKSIFPKWFGIEPELEDKYKWQHPFREDQLNGSLVVLRHKRLEDHS